MPTYTVSNVKTFKGRQGEGYSCDLLADGRKIADVLEGASGGPLGVEFYYSAKITPAAAALDEGVFKAFLLEKFGADEIEPEYAFIEDIVGVHLQHKQLASKLKREILIVTDDNKIYGWNSKKHPENTIRKMITEKYPKAFVLNDMDIEDAFELVMQVQKK